jgi:hypothetical protein
MNDFRALEQFVSAGDVRDAIEDLRRTHVVALRQADFGARRAVVRTGFDVEAGGTSWRSLWLITHRPLRRAGVRRHPASAIVLAAWRGHGLVLLRGPKERRSVDLAPLDTTGDVAVRFVSLAPGTYFDTLADDTPWHVLAFHSQPALHLAREDETQEGWNEKPEEADS